MAKESIFFTPEDHDAQIAIVVILGVLALFMYPYYVIGGALIISAIFAILVVLGRWHDDRTGRNGRAGSYRTVRRAVNSR